MQRMFWKRYFMVVKMKPKKDRSLAVFIWFPPKKITKRETNTANVQGMFCVC